MVLDGCFSAFSPGPTTSCADARFYPRPPPPPPDRFRFGKVVIRSRSSSKDAYDSAGFLAERSVGPLHKCRVSINGGHQIAAVPSHGWSAGWRAGGRASDARFSDDDHRSGDGGMRRSAADVSLFMFAGIGENPRSTTPSNGNRSPPHQNQTTAGAPQIVGQQPAQPSCSTLFQQHLQQRIASPDCQRAAGVAVSPRHRNSTGSNSSQASSGFESMKVGVILGRNLRPSPPTHHLSLID